jgi:uncharacterized protein involved in type VI secretion and phage assembly
VGELKLGHLPGALDAFVAVGLHVDLNIGCVGTLSMRLHPRETSQEPDLGRFSSLQAALGEDVSLEYDSLSFAGTIHELAYESTPGAEVSLSLTLADALFNLARNHRSQVFADRKLKDVVREIVGASGSSHKLSSDFEGYSVKLAIQYEESDLAFLKRLVNYYGGQVWCSGDTIYVGGVAGAGGPEKLRLHREVPTFTLHTGLGPEEVEVEKIRFGKEQQGEQRVDLSDTKKYGSIQQAAMGRRAEKQGKSKVLFHVALDDSRGDYPEFLAKRFLRFQAAHRLSMTGTLTKAIPPGTLVEISDADNNTETLAVRSLAGSWSVDTGAYFQFMASTPEALIVDAALPEIDLRVSAAVVDKVEDTVNRVCVRFPWDKRQAITPPLRIATPLWGDEHVQYARFKKGDTVLVIWGQEEIDPIVLGALPTGQKVEKSDTYVVKIGDGRLISFGKNDIRIENKADGGRTKIEILPNKVVIDSDSIELKSKQAKIDSDSTELKSKQAKVDSTKVEIKAPMTAIKTMKLDVG